MRSSRLVAETLRDVPDPLATALPPVRPATESVLAALARGGIGPCACPDDPPACLRPGQVAPWRRAMAALAGWRGAILAEPVGSGKTWIALGVALALDTTVTVIAPATLREQWQHVAARVGVALRFHTFERLSRGHPPPPAGFVIVDEAHRLRHLDTRRTRTLAPWLVGRTTLFLTATPLVNRRADLLALLSLLVADDALAMDGIPSLAALERRAIPPSALRRLVIRSSSPMGRPHRRERSLRNPAQETARGRRIATTVDRLVLSDDPGVRALLRLVLLDAGASSDAAWRLALERYRNLLLQSRDAGGVSRAALRQCLGDALDQLVLWPMMGVADRASPPPLVDLPVIANALHQPSGDSGWLDAIARLLSDRRPSICFCRHRATADLLRRHLGAGTAWVTGEGAGIGLHRVPRAALLAAFGPGRESWPYPVAPPSVLVATEVLAEGLDLQGASRVVHVDLPWHDTRLEQRTGRVWRIGQVAREIEVVHRQPVGAIERRLGMARRVRRKRSLATRWLEALAEGPPAGTTVEPGVWLHVLHAHRPRRPLVVLGIAAGMRSGCCAIDGDHGVAPWEGDDQCCAPGLPPSVGERHVATALAVAAVRRAIRMSAGRPAGRHALVARLLRLARSASVRHDAATLGRLDRWLAVATRPGSHGLELRLRELAGADDRVVCSTEPPPLVELALPSPTWVVVCLYRRERTALP